MRKFLSLGLAVLLLLSIFIVDVSATSKSTPTPTKTALRTVVPKIKVESDSLVISWASIKNAEEYLIYRALKQNGDYSLLAKTSGVQHVDKDVVVGTVYYYRVEAIANDASSKLSNPIKGLVPTPKPTPQLKTPANLRVVNKGNYNLVSWNKVAGASNYVVYRSIGDNKGFSRIASTEHTEHKDYNISEGRTYYYRIESAYETNISKQSAEKKVVVPTPTPIAYKAIGYKNVARNPDHYKGQYVKFTNCRVVQQIDIDKSSDIQAIITVGGYNNVMYLNLPGFKDWEWTGSFEKTGVSRLLEGDRIEIKGIVLGSHTYTTINNQTLTVPHIEVEHMWLYD